MFDHINVACPGEYVVQYGVPFRGTYRIEVTLYGKHVRGSPFTIWVSISVVPLVLLPVQLTFIVIAPRIRPDTNIRPTTASSSTTASCQLSWPESVDPSPSLPMTRSASSALVLTLLPRFARE